MSKIDSRLKYLQTQKDDAILRALESVGRFGLEVKNVPAPRVRVLVQHSGDVADLEREGVEITSTAGDVVRVWSPLTGLMRLLRLPRCHGLKVLIR